jgi:hypothetical protein
LNQKAEVRTPTSRRDDVGDDGLREDHQPSPTKTLYGARGDEHRHGARKPAKHRAGQEQDKGNQQKGLMPE